MRLTSIDAVRYGGLEGCSISGLSEDLTVVLGPNESGKSTFTAMTRHVLYGFPDRRSKERGYVPAAGPREARLVFAGADGEWALDRVDGAKGGPVTVTARRGAERAGLLGELVGGVSEQTFRVVFGFGIDELAEIERSSDSDIVARLYAAGTGLSVNPIDVRKTLEQRAGELYAPRAQKPRVNELAARVRELRERIRTLEEQAARFGDEQTELEEMTGQLPALRAHREELDARVRTLAGDIERVKTARRGMEELVARERQLRATITDLERSLELAPDDERVLAAAPVLTTVLDDASGFRAKLEAANTAQIAADRVRDEIASKSELPSDARDSEQARAAVEQWRDRLADLRRKAEAAMETATQTRIRAEQTARTADDIAPAAPAARRPVAAGVAVIAVGIAAVAAGIVTAQWIAAVLGMLAMAAGVYLLVRPVAAVAAQPLTEEVARAQADERTAAVAAETAQADYEEGLAEWRSWLAGQSLDAYGEDPVAVRRLLEALAERDRMEMERARHLADAARERGAAEEWVVRLVDAVRQFDDSAGQIPPLQGAAELAARAKQRLERALADRAERDGFERELRATRTALDGLNEQLEAHRQMAASVADQHGLGEADPLPQLEALAVTAAEELEAATAQCDLVSERIVEHRTRLDSEARNDAMARSRQELEGVRDQAREAADRYVTEALAVRLLDRARERFESERQPEVVRTAARIFSAMTSGRYQDVRVPLDGSGVTVLRSDGVTHSTELLSRGAAEQLYLALRIGLIASLGETGRSLPVLMDDVIVNFDPERRDGAAIAVAELAALKQVVFFTCSPDTAQALTNKVTGATVIELDRCALRN